MDDSILERGKWKRIPAIVLTWEGKARLRDCHKGVPASVVGQRDPTPFGVS